MSQLFIDISLSMSAKRAFSGKVAPGFPSEDATTRKWSGFCLTPLCQNKGGIEARSSRVVE
jgi:hypothetical protein